jgi:hypothetical protein
MLGRRPAFLLRRLAGAAPAVIALVLLALPVLALAACQKPAPAAAPQPRRKSFAESGNWQPSAPAAPAAAPAGATASGGAGTTPESIQRGWQQVEQTKGEAAQQQAAGEMLNRTQALADQPAASGTPH